MRATIADNELRYDGIEVHDFSEAAPGRVTVDLDTEACFRIADALRERATQMRADGDGDVGWRQVHYLAKFFEALELGLVAQRLARQAAVAAPAPAAD